MLSMRSREEPDTRASTGDEIGVLARRYLDESGSYGLERIDGRIARATERSDWDDVSKWHRVRLRFLRFQQDHALYGGPRPANDARG